jgi:phospholipase A1
MRAIILIILGIAVFMPFFAVAGTAGTFAECSSIDDDNARLKCYDDAAGRTSKTAETGTSEGKSAPAALSPPIPKTAAKPQDPPDPTGLSVLARQWDLDETNRAKKFVIKPYRGNYVLPVAYNTSPNDDAYLDLDTNAKPQHTEAKFQISFKVKLWEDILGRDVDLWFGYTQLAFWQVYNRTLSSPFRETDYEPELLLNFRTDYDVFGLKGRFINLGLNHQSNGRSEPLSRSWNRVVANFGFERGPFNMLLKTWYRIPESESDDDNPDIEKYMGYGELWGYYFWKKTRFGMMVRNNLRSDNKGAIQLEYAVPLIERISAYFQYFNGYGESLADYNKSVNRISIGFMLTDWY